ncbi:BA14K family protein [Neorhizobium sp. NPDC001467]|uniref:BA14K family protein n=1 Tax=Neorhizobium sp. NPDC001467 TaxID=3390595 RepID=UPI003CFD2CA1
MKPIIAVPLKLAACLTMGIAGVIGASYAASLVTDDYEPHRFAHMDAPLWTDRPVVIDRHAQELERLPPLVASADLPAQDVPLGGEIASAANAVSPVRSGMDGEVSQGNAGNVDSDDASIQMAVAQSMNDAAAAPVQLTAAHVDWCFARYRSYRIEDNSYQPFDAPGRQQCQSPHEAAAPIADASSDMGSSDAVGTRAFDQGVADADNSGRDIASDSMTGELVAEREPQMVADSGRVDTAWCFAQYRSYRAEDNSYQPYDGGPRRQCVPRDSSY